MKVLVTGGAGFIGSHLVDKLVEENYDVVVLDDLSSGRLGNIKAHIVEGRAKFVEGSITEEKVVRRGVHGMDAVVHLAAVVSVPYSFAHPKETYETNVFGTKVLLDQCIANKVEKFVLASTCAVYGEASHTPIDEAHSTDPVSPYAESKLVAEQMLVKDYGEELETVALRFFNVYGLRQLNNGYSGVITAFKESLQTERPLEIHGDGLQTRDFVHVSDVVNAVWLATNAEAEGIFNVCSGRAVTIRKLAEVMTDLAGRRDLEAIFTSPREGDIRHSHGTYARAREAFGFKPEVDLRRGLSELLEEISPRRRLATAF